MTDETLYSALHWAKKAEYWAGQASQGQIQADWAQTDNTKKDFIKNKPGINDLLPSQTGNSGKFLTTNGTASSWSTVDALPAQTGQSGKFLTTNGSNASWSTVDALPSQSGQSGKYLTTNGTNASWGALDLSAYAPKASPAFTGTPTCPTPGNDVNTQQLVNTAYINNKFQVVSSEPASPAANTIYFVVE